MIGRNYFTRQAAILFKFAQTTKDPKVAAALIEKAADLKLQVDEPGARPDPTLSALNIMTPVATAMACHNPAPLHPFGGELGWVAGDPAHAGKGLGLAVCTAVTARFLSAGYHNVMGYFRDDTPLMELILDEQGQKKLNRLWDEFDFISDFTGRTCRRLRPNSPCTARSTKRAYCT